jgi:hypothetical protein
MYFTYKIAQNKLKDEHIYRILNTDGKINKIEHLKNMK